MLRNECCSGCWLAGKESKMSVFNVVKNHVAASAVVFAAVVSSDGTVAALDVTGGIGLHGGGTLVLSGDVGKIAAGSYPLAAVNSGTAAGWTVAVSEPTRKRFQLSVEDGRLVLTVIPPGAILIVK